MIKENIQKEIQKTFRGKDTFSRGELLNIYKQYEPTLNENTFAWRIHDLKAKGILRDVRKGIYQLRSSKRVFTPELEPKQKALFKKIRDNFNQVDLCIWATAWLNEFSIHQSPKSLLIVETDPDIKESVFYFLREELHKQAYLEPDQKTFDRYAINASEPIIVTKLVSKSPLQQVKGATVPRLEKILVDVFSTEEYFPAYQGEELSHMFEYAYKHYDLNFSTLFNYSRRRGKEQLLQDFLLNFSHIPPKVVTG